MNNGRTPLERRAIKSLMDLLDPDQTRSRYQREQQINRFVMHLVNAAEEVRIKYEAEQEKHNGKPAHVNHHQV